MKSNKQLRETIDAEKKCIWWGATPSTDLGVLVKRIDELQYTFALFTGLMLGATHQPGWLKLAFLVFLGIMVLIVVQVIALSKMRDMMIEKGIFNVDVENQDKE